LGAGCAAFRLIGRLRPARDKPAMSWTGRFIIPAAIALGLTAAAVLTSARGGEAAAGDLIVSAWARATPPGAKVGAAYVTVENRASEPDRLVEARSPAAESVHLHQTVEENGVAAMRPLEPPEIPGGGALDMAPGGLHFMLMELKAPLKEGETVPLTLVFERAGEIAVEAEIAPIGAAAPAQHDHAM
jgi:copper(I)-binding protein